MTEDYQGRHAGLPLHPDGPEPGRHSDARRICCHTLPGQPHAADCPVRSTQVPPWAPFIGQGI